MRWKRPHHTRWLAACLLALLISTLAGGFSLRVATVFLVIFVAGAALLNLDDTGQVADDRAYDYPDNDGDDDAVSPDEPQAAEPEQPEEPERTEPEQTEEPDQTEPERTEVSGSA